MVLALDASPPPGGTWLARPSHVEAGALRESPGQVPRPAGATASGSSAAFLGLRAVCEPMHASTTVTTGGGRTFRSNPIPAQAYAGACGSSTSGEGSSPRATAAARGRPSTRARSSPTRWLGESPGTSEQQLLQVRVRPRGEIVELSGRAGAQGGVFGGCLIARRPRLPCCPHLRPPQPTVVTGIEPVIAARAFGIPPAEASRDDR